MMLLKAFFLLVPVVFTQAWAPSTKSRRNNGFTRLYMSADEFLVGVVGDLHMDPRKMEDYEIGRSHWEPIFAEAKEKHGNTALVSLGDLGESKSVRPKETSELFAGTTECHELAAKYLGSFGVPYDVIGGNHDLEGLDEFATDQANLEMFLRVHNKPTPQFSRLVAEKTLLVGLSSTVFRDARYTSHEVTIDDDQMNWFEETLKTHPSSEGWKVFVFTHAPPNGSGLRVLQENHVVNGCCWLNHSDDKKCRKFIELVREHRCIKAWFSGHFHLGQDYQDSISKLYSKLFHVSYNTWAYVTFSSHSIKPSPLSIPRMVPTPIVVLVFLCRPQLCVEEPLAMVVSNPELLGEIRTALKYAQ